MVRLSIWLRQEAGTCCGGVDIMMHVEVNADKGVIRTPAVLEREFTTALNEWVSKLDVEGAGEWEPDSDFYLSGDSTHLKSAEDGCGYEISLDEPLSQVRADLLKWVMEGEWWQSMKTGECRIENDFYCEGNAD